MSNPIDSLLDTGVYRMPERPAEAGNRPADAAGGKAASGSQATDLLDLTGQARALKALEENMARAPEFDSQRVAELKQALVDGSYKVNAERIADKLLSMESLLP